MGGWGKVGKPIHYLICLFLLSGREEKEELRQLRQDSRKQQRKRRSQVIRDTNEIAARVPNPGGEEGEGEEIGDDINISIINETTDNTLPINFGYGLNYITGNQLNTILFRNHEKNVNTFM